MFYFEKLAFQFLGVSIYIKNGQNPSQVSLSSSLIWEDEKSKQTAP
jgi:hypothetical protein